MSNLKDVVVGDAVAVCGGYNGNEWSKRTVTKITATQVTLSDGSRWLKRGRKVGVDPWGRSREYAEPWDEAEHAKRLTETQRKRLAEVIGRLPFARLSMDQLQRIRAIFDEAKP